MLQSRIGSLNKFEIARCILMAPLTVARPFLYVSHHTQSAEVDSASTRGTAWESRQSSAGLPGCGRGLILVYCCV